MRVASERRAPGEPPSPAPPPVNAEQDVLRAIADEWAALARESQRVMRDALASGLDPRASAIAGGIASQRALELERFLGRTAGLPAALPEDEAARRGVSEDLLYRAAREGSSRALDRIAEAQRPRDFRIVFEDEPEPEPEGEHGNPDRAADAPAA